MDTQNHSINDTGYQFYVGASLGNNGKLVIMPETGIKLTKKMAEENSDVTEEFRGNCVYKYLCTCKGNFEIEILAETAGTYYVVVCEDTSVSARLVTFDRTVFWVSIEVEDVDGVLVAREPVVTLADSTEPLDGIIFRNVYNPNIPQTGDTSNLTLWVSLMVLSAIAAAALLVFEKRRTQA